MYVFAQLACMFCLIYPIINTGIIHNLAPNNNILHDNDDNIVVKEFSKIDIKSDPLYDWLYSAMHTL